MLSRRQVVARPMEFPGMDGIIGALAVARSGLMSRRGRGSMMDTDYTDEDGYLRMVHPCSLACLLQVVTTRGAAPRTPLARRWALTMREQA